MSSMTLRVPIPMWCANSENSPNSGERAWEMRLLTGPDQRFAPLARSIRLPTEEANPKPDRRHDRPSGSWFCRQVVRRPVPAGGGEVLHGHQGGEA